MILKVVAERRKRELEPTAAAIRQCLALASAETAPESRAAVARLTELVDAMLALHGRLQSLPAPVLKALLKTGGA